MMAESEGIDVAPPQLQEFVPGVSPDISLFSTVSIYGKRKSGKSVFIKWFLQSYKEWFPWYWVFTLTQLNSFYESFIAAKFVIPEFDAEMMERVMERQTLARKLAEEQIIQGDGVKINPRACIIWDDYNGNDVRYNQALARYYYTGRSNPFTRKNEVCEKNFVWSAFYSNCCKYLASSMIQLTFLYL